MTSAPQGPRSQGRQHTPLAATHQPAAPNVDTRGFFDRYETAFAIGLTVLTALMALLLFNARLNEGGDDSTYICRALDLLADGRYPDFQGPLYPLFLAPFIALCGGVNLMVLKLTSVVLLAAGQLLMWWALRRRVPAIILLAAMLLMAVAPLFVQFGSLTYSEPLYMCLQWVAIGLLLRFDNVNDDLGWTHIGLRGLTIGIALVACALTRTIGLAWLPIALVFLALRRQWFKACSVLAGFLVVWLLWASLRGAIWGVDTQGDKQLQTLLQVDPYDPSAGLESASGYFERFTGNSELYLSKHYAKMFGLRDTASRETSVPLTVAFYLLFAWGGWQCLRRNRALTLIVIAALTFLVATFCSLQVLWDQCRLILPFCVMLHLIVLYGLAELLRLVLPSQGYAITGGLAALAALVLFGKATQQMDFMTLRKNLRGDTLTGYTPDWYNYLNLCQNVEKLTNDPQCYVACRKPNMARIYSGGRKFYGIYTIPSQDADTLVAQLRERGVTHAIAASLRRDPAQAGLGVINTMHRFLNVIITKYPYFVEQIAVSGGENQEPAALYKLHYELAVPGEDNGQDSAEAEGDTEPDTVNDAGQ